MKIDLKEVRKSISNNTNKSNTDMNKIYSIYQETDAMDKRTAYQSFFEEQCGFGILMEEYPDREEELQGIKDLLVDVCMSAAESIRISGDDKPAAVVRGQLMKLNIEHIRYVLGCMAENTTKVANPKAYMLASLYNAPLTMGSYYRSRVNHDLNAL